MKPEPCISCRYLPFLAGVVNSTCEVNLFQMSRHAPPARANWHACTCIAAFISCTWSLREHLSRNAKHIKSARKGSRRVCWGYWLSALNSTRVVSWKELQSRDHKIGEYELTVKKALCQHFAIVLKSLWECLQKFCLRSISGRSAGGFFFVAMMPLRIRASLYNFHG